MRVAVFVIDILQTLINKLGNIMTVCTIGGHFYEEELCMNVDGKREKGKLRGFCLA